MPLLGQAIWGNIWKRTVEKCQTNATNLTLPLLSTQTVCEKCKKCKCFSSNALWHKRWKSKSQFTKMLICLNVTRNVGKRGRMPCAAGPASLCGARIYLSKFLKYICRKFQNICLKSQNICLKSQNICRKFQNICLKF